ncbi:hypothetical protein [Aliikangiella sp. IMCC44632]
MSIFLFQSAVIGGTISKVTGGKFANGSITAAFQFVMNEYISSKYSGSIGVKKIFKAIEVEYSTNQGFEAKLVKELWKGGVNVELDSNGKIKIFGRNGAQIISSIGDSKYALEGAY